MRHPKLRDTLHAIECGPEPVSALAFHPYHQVGGCVLARCVSGVCRARRARERAGLLHPGVGIKPMLQSNWRVSFWGASQCAVRRLNAGPYPGGRLAHHARTHIRYRTLLVPLQVRVCPDVRGVVRA